MWQNPAMAKLLGIDVGTSGVKAVLVNENGEILGQGSASYGISSPQPLWSEQNPEDWWRGTQQALEQIGEPAPDAIGLTGQMHGSVFLDEAGEVIRPALLWNDQRTAEEVALIDETVGPDKVRAITCNPPLTGFQAPKVLWLKRHEPENFARLRQVLLPKDYIRYRLSGDFATDVSDASGTGLFDVPKRNWSKEMMEALGLSEEWFPATYESDEISAKTDGSGYFQQGVPIASGGGDQAAGAVGTGAVEPGIVSVSLGTSGVVFSAIPAADADPSGAAHVFCHTNRAWHAMGVMLSCGGALAWFRDTFHPNATFDQLGEMAQAAPVGSDGLTFLPYLTGERCPHNDPLARGSFSGLTLRHGPNEIARSVFEGVSFGILDGMKLLENLGASADRVRVSGGGAKGRFWVQMIADLFGKPCATLQVDEGPAYGAAILGGVGTGVWPDVQTACRHAVREKAEIKPSGEDYSNPYSRYADLYPALRSWNKQTSKG
jgi:xylulokinase